ncbi:MAG: histidinol-phosphatase HisJ family protein [Lachnospiraceae bacterium]|jgi:histidinol-phosphatase (PHP family)|nr:histidinol-phosphatase HisJ family protein [Lachnospiraceae bacterium]
MEEQIRSAESRGLESLCFTEHYDMDFPYDRNPEISKDRYGMFELDMEAYRSDFLKQKEALAKQQSRNVPPFEIRFGIELGLLPGLNVRYHSFLEENPDLDFVIGSTHLCGSTDPFYPRFYEGRTEEEAYREYFSFALSCIRSCDCFDSYGHLDYVVRYGPHKDRDYSYEKYSDLIDPMLSVLIDRGKALELNTAPFGKGCREQNPSASILRRYRQLGGEMVTVGADAHVPENVALRFDTAAEVLSACGFRYYTVFRERRPVFCRL